jgi:hypothetical protein
MRPYNIVAIMGILSAGAADAQSTGEREFGFSTVVTSVLSPKPLAARRGVDDKL